MNLDGFTGTTKYHKLDMFRDLVATDGFSYLCKEAKCYWLFDIIASVQHKSKLVQERNFIIWRVVKKGKGCIVSGYTDCDSDGTYSKDKEVYSQNVPYIDFPFNELNNKFEFYQQGNVLLLKSEY